VSKAEIKWPTLSKGFVDFHENIIFLYGVPKIGKTSLSAQFSDALFMLTEDGAKHVQVAGYKINKWKDFVSRITLIEAEKASFPFKTIVIDTVDNLANQCIQHICAQYSLNTLGDLDYGKGYAHFEREFKGQMTRLLNLGFGMVFISHDEEKNVDIGAIANPYAPVVAGDDNKTKMIIPTLDKRPRKFLLGLSDIILYYKINGDGKRSIYTKPSQYFEAGDRSGRLANSINMGASAKDGYTALLDSYYGDQSINAQQTLISRIGKAFEYLIANDIDNFATMSRQSASISKHLGVAHYRDCKDIPKLQKYLQHLTMKANNGNKIKETK